MFVICNANVLVVFRLWRNKNGSTYPRVLKANTNVSVAI